MKKLIVSLFFILVFLLSGLAQKSSFDIASYSAPAGWQKSDNGNLVSYTVLDSAKGSLCILTIYKSTDGSGNADNDFTQQWNEKVTTPFGGSGNPKLQKVNGQDGWEARIGADTFSRNGTTYISLLTVMSGYNKVLDILVLTNNKKYLVPLDAFYKSMVLQKPGAQGGGMVPDPNNNGTNNGNTGITDNSNANTGDNSTSGSGAGTAGGNAGSISYTLPEGWTPGRAPNGIVKAESPLLECTDQSYYTLFIYGVDNYSGDLQEYARKLHKLNFYQPDPVFQYPEAGRRVVKGINENGMEYLSFEAPSVVFKSDHSFHYGYVYLLRSGTQTAAFMLELRPQNSDKFMSPSSLTIYFLYSCAAIHTSFNKFLASVKFAQDGPKKSIAPADLVGTWDSRLELGASVWGYVSSLPLQKYHFTEDGRWQSQKMAIENNFGKYQVSGNKLVITDGAGKTTKYRFKLERIFEYNTWNRYLTLFDANGIEQNLSYSGD